MLFSLLAVLQHVPARRQIGAEEVGSPELRIMLGLYCWLAGLTGACET